VHGELHSNLYICNHCVSNAFYSTEMVLFVNLSRYSTQIIVLYFMNINKDILIFYWLRFVMWFYFIFHGMTTKSSKEVIIYHVILHWPVDIVRLNKLKWRPINPVSIEIWNSIQLLHFIEYIQQYFSYVVAVSYIGGGSRRTRRKPPTCRK
jgi:hypothetical protein